MKKFTRYLILALTIAFFSIYNFFQLSSKNISDTEKINTKAQANKLLKFKTTTELEENNHLLTTLNFDDVTYDSVNKKEQRFPEMLIVGESKCGTGTLVEYLNIHPDVKSPPLGTELCFFSKRYDKGFDWYKSQMPYTSEHELTFEKTPGYFRWNETPKRIYDFNPKMKLVLIVRNPVTRAISHFTHGLSKKDIEITPENQKLINENFKEIIFDKSGNIRKNKEKIISPGRYVDSYKRWLKYFPKSQILVLDGENFIINPYEEVKKAEKFLNLKPYIEKNHFIYDKKKGFFCIDKNLNTKEIQCMKDTKGRPHPIISSDLVNSLKNYYKQYDKEFFNLIEQKPFW